MAKDSLGDRTFTEGRVWRGDYRIRVTEYQGDEPAIVLMHGFPDNLHLYDRLVPHLAGRLSSCSTSSAGATQTSLRITSTPLPIWKETSTPLWRASALTA